MRLLVAFATIYVVWGSTYLAIAYALESIPPLLLMGVRSLLAGGILYAWARASGEQGPARASWRPALLAGGFMFLGSHGLLAWSEQRVASGMAALIVATGTFWMMGVEWLRPGGARPSRLAGLGAAIGLGGVGMLVGGADTVDPIGAGALLVSSLLWAIGSFFTRGAATPYSPRMATSLPLLTGGVLLLAASAVTGELGAFDVAAVDGPSILGLAYLVVFGSVIGFTAYVWLMRNTSAVNVSTHNYINPVVAVLLGWLVAGEVVTARTLVAAAVIVASIVLMRPRAPASSGGKMLEGRRVIGLVSGTRRAGSASLPRPAA